MDWATDNVQLILAAIERGYLDDQLRTLARALFARRDVINGTTTVIPDGTVVHDVTLTAKDLGITEQAAVGHPGPFLSPASVPGGSIPYVGTFEYRGLNYRKKDLVGKNIRIPARTWPGKAAVYNGLPIRIDGVGPKRVKAVFLGGADQMTGRMREAALNGTPVFLPHRVLREVLQTA